MKKLSLSFILTLLSVSLAWAQSGIEMATGLRSSGKIWVVVLVLLTIVIGVYIFLFSIDRKVKKLEQK